MQYALQVSTPASQVLAPVAPQELQSQKLAFLTKRANRAAGMQMIVHSPHVIYPVGQLIPAAMPGSDICLSAAVHEALA